MKRAGIHEIAELAKVSIGTVDRALHNRPGIRESTRRRILRIAKKLHYTPHLAARALSVGRSSIKIGVCIPEEIRFFYDQLRMGIFDEARRAGGIGIEIVYQPVPSLGQGEEARISGLLQSGISGLIVTPGNPKEVNPLIKQAEEQGIRVICLTTDAPQSHRTAFVGINPELSGRIAAELMAKFLPQKSIVAVVTGMLEAEEHRLKSKGFRTGFQKECKGGRIAAVVEAHESEEESYQKTCRLIDANPDLQGIYVSTVNCLPVCRGLQDRNAAARVQLITTDLFPEMVPYFRKGMIRASIYQDPYSQGQMAVRVLADLLLNRTLVSETNFVNPEIVLRANLELFRESRTKAKMLP
jgi:LacI family transcriptional regulator